MSYYLNAVSETMSGFFKLIVTWPGVFLIMIILFRGELSRLIERLKYVDFGNKRASFEQEEQKSGSEDIERKAKELEKEISDAKSSSEKEKAKLNRELFFERTYVLIFRTQIELLRELRKFKIHGLFWNALFSKYNIILANYNFGHFMNFLHGSGFITWERTQNGLDTKVIITRLGEEFLDYIDSRNYNALTKTF